MFTKIYYAHYLCIHIYAKAILLDLIKAWDRTSEERRDGKIEEHKLNETGALNMKHKKLNKLDKSKRSSYSPVVFIFYFFQLFLNMTVH